MDLKVASLRYRANVRKYSALLQLNIIFEFVTPQIVW